MRKVDRLNYCVDRNTAYVDDPQGIILRQNISAPHIHAMFLTALLPKLVPGSKVLEIGSGSGYLTACLGLMVGSRGRVVGIDMLREMVEFGAANINREHPNLISGGTVVLKHGNGYDGDPSEGPYDAILVSAAAPRMSGLRDSYL